MEALNRRLQRLDKELEDLAPQLEEARAAYVEASGSSKEAAMREMWQRMANVKDTLLQQRQSLYDKLGGAAPDFVEAFKEKLRQEHVAIKDGPMCRLAIYFGERMRTAAQPSVDSYEARLLYDQAVALPGTETKLELLEQEQISVDGPWMQHQPSLVTAVDLKSGSLLVLKILAIDSEELKFAAAAEKRALERLQLDRLPANSVLVPMKLQTVRVRQEHVLTMRMGLGEDTALKMPLFASSLDRLPQLSEELIYQGGRRLQEAVQLMHAQGLLHADLKAANVLLNDAKTWCLGDYGSSVEFGEKIVSCTEGSYPGKIKGELAEPKYDWGLLAVLLAVELNKADISVLTGDIEPAKVQRDLLLERCELATHAGLKELLKGLLKDAQLA